MQKIKSSLISRIKRFKNKNITDSTSRRNIGKNSYVDPSVQVIGWNNVRIGENSIISEDTWINVNYRGEENVSVIIGNNSFIGRRNFFTSGDLIKIGDYCLTGVDCKFLGSGHIYNSPFIPYITSGTTEDGLIEIGSNCWVGANVTILKNVKIGYGSIIGASTVVNRDIPPFSVIVGNPYRILKRFDMQSQTWVSTQEYPVDGDQYLPSEFEYLEILNKTKFNMKDLWIASSKAFGDI
jgi:acetyltransferase-like isoleucine patch superfamily enzyme